MAMTCPCGIVPVAFGNDLSLWHYKVYIFDRILCCACRDYIDITYGM